MKNTVTIIALLALAAVLTAAVSDKIKKEKAKAPEGFAFVPSGVVRVDSTKQTVQAFYISKTEVTNKQYRTFLDDLKAKGDMESYQLAMVDSTKWFDNKMYNAPLVEFYFRHPAYDNYPVVNVSYEGAVLYCKWLTSKTAGWPCSGKTAFRLPFRAEWIMAARGGLESAEYSWSGPYLKGGKKGAYLCNFKNLGAENIHYNSITGSYEVVTDYATGFVLTDNAQITAPVEAYWANDYGLFNMCGNVAEWVQEKSYAAGGCWNSTGYDVRVESVMTYEGPSPFVGFRPVVTYLGTAQ